MGLCVYEHRKTSVFTDDDKADENEKPAAAAHLFGCEKETPPGTQRSGLPAGHPAQLLKRRQSENSVTQTELYRGWSSENE